MDEQASKVFKTKSKKFFFVGREEKKKQNKNLYCFFSSAGLTVIFYIFIYALSLCARSIIYE